MIIGYIRVSKNKQLTALQADAMAKAGCSRTFTDKMTWNCVASRRISIPPRQQADSCFMS